MPEAKECVGLSTGKLFCVSENGEEEVHPMNYLCTDSDGYEALRDNMLCLQNELEKCYRQPKQCKPNMRCGWQPKNLEELRIQQKLREQPQPEQQE